MHRFTPAILVSVLLGVLLAAGRPAVAYPMDPHGYNQLFPDPDKVGNWTHGRGATGPSRAVRIIGQSVPLSGTVKLLAIPVEFAMDNARETSGIGTFPYRAWGPASEPGYLQNRLNKVSQYYAIASGNRINLQCTLTRVVRLPGVMTNYRIPSDDPAVTDNATMYANDNKMMRGVVADIDGEVNFANYDIVILIHAGAGFEMPHGTGLLEYYDKTGKNVNSTKDIHSHVTPDMTTIMKDGKPYSVTTNDAVTIASWGVLPETECNDYIFLWANQYLDGNDPTKIRPFYWYERDPSYYSYAFNPHYIDVVGVWCHEIGHCFGLPDLYDTQYGGGVSVGIWSLMAGGGSLPDLKDDELIYWLVPYDANRPLFSSVPCLLDAWSKKYLGWTTLTNITSRRLNQQLLPEGASNSVVYRLWTNGDNTSREYFLAENRAQVGQDLYLPESGLMVYHIDDTVGSITANNLQNSSMRPRVYPLSSDNKLEIESYSNGKTMQAPVLDTVFPGTTRISHLGAATTPSLESWDGIATYVDISNIRQVGTTIYADFQTASPATITFTNPEEGTTLYVSRPTVRCLAPNLDPLNQTVTLNGQIIISNAKGNVTSCYNTDTGALTIPLDGTTGGPLQVGDYQIVVSGQDLANAVMVSSSLNFSVREKMLTTELQMVSFPVINIGTVSSVFTGQPTMELARWDAETKAYKKYPDSFVEFTNTTGAVVDRENPSNVMAPAGKAFWVRNLSATTALRMPGDLLLNRQQYYLLLTAGFNMIGNPYTYPVAYGTMLVEYQGTMYSMDEAVLARLIDPALYNWAGGDKGYGVAVLPNGILDPWVGYWVHALVGTASNPLKLIFQPAPTVSSGTRQAATLPRNRGTVADWECTVKATAPGAGAATVTVGAQPKATANLDAGIDLYAPPAAPGMLTFSSAARSGGLLRDYRAGSATAQSWDLDVTGPAGATVTLTWPDLTRLPADTDVTLTDTVSGSVCYLRTSAACTITLGTGETRRRLMLTATPGHATGLQVQGLVARRARAGSGALISCQLTQPATVAVEIRTATGVLVRRLDGGARAQGAVLMAWDGKDAAGRAVPRGMYQCQVMATAGTGQAVKAMTLLPPL